MRSALWIGVLVSGVLGARLRVGKGRNEDGVVWFDSVGACVEYAAGLGVPVDCEVDPGVYSEGVKAPEGVGIVGVGDGVEMVGYEVINSTWNAVGGGVYETVVDIDHVEQVFAFNTSANRYDTMFEARWPNVASYHDMLNPNISFSPTTIGSHYGHLCSATLGNTEIDLNGALAILSVAHEFYTWTRVISNYTVESNGRACFDFPKNLPGITFYANVTAPWESNKFALQGLRELLDAPNEWYYNATSHKLAVMLEGGREPKSGEIAVRVRDFCIETAGSVRNVAMTACTFSVNCSGCSVSIMEINYPSYSRIIPESYPTGDPNHGKANQTKAMGSDITLYNVSLARTNVAGIAIEATGANVSEMLVDSTNWFGTLWYGAATLGGERVNVSHSTFRYSGNAIVHHGCARPQGWCNHTVQYSSISHGGMIGLDSANLYTGSFEDSGTLWYRNWVWGAREKVARFDDQSEAITAVQLVLFDGGIPVHDKNDAGFGFVLKGNDHIVVGLSVWGTSTQDLSIPGCAEPKKPWAHQHLPLLQHQNNNSHIVNSAFHTLGARGGCGKDPMNIGGLYSGCYNHSTDIAELLEDPKNFNFTPKANSPLIDAGVVFPPWTNGYVGKAPDIGAYERGGEYWVPGCSAREACFVGEPDIVRRMMH